MRLSIALFTLLIAAPAYAVETSVQVNTSTKATSTVTVSNDMKIVNASVSGTVEIRTNTNGKETYEKITIDDAEETGDDRPMETIKLDYGKVEDTTTGGGGSNEIKMDDTDGAEKEVGSDTAETVVENIVINGNDVRQTPRTDFGTVLKNGVQTAEDLSLFAQAVAQTDVNVQAIEITSSSVSVGYTQLGKLFGFIPISFTLHTVVDTSGAPEAKVKKPWWAFLMRDEIDEYRKQLEWKLTGIGTEIPLQKLQQVLQTISNISKMTSN